MAKFNPKTYTIEIERDLQKLNSKFRDDLEKLNKAFVEQFPPLARPLMVIGVSGKISGEMSNAIMEIRNKVQILRDNL